MNPCFNTESLRKPERPGPIILIIDEVGSVSNHQVFLDFLALLRKYDLVQRNSPIFRSVILRGSRCKEFETYNVA